MEYYYIYNILLLFIEWVYRIVLDDNIIYLRYA